MHENKLVRQPLIVRGRLASTLYRLNWELVLLIGLIVGFWSWLGYHIWIWTR